MSKLSLKFQCPNCKNDVHIDLIILKTPKEIGTYCEFCYFPLFYNTKSNRAVIRLEKQRKKAFLIHSSKRKDMKDVEWLRALLRLYGISTIIIEEDTRVKVGWLQKSLDAIKNSDFTIAFLTKRYQFTDEKGQGGWRAPDKCYDEIAMSFAIQRDLFGLVEKETDSGRVLEDRAWYFQFEKKPTQGGAPITLDSRFFNQLDLYTNSDVVPI